MEVRHSTVVPTLRLSNHSKGVASALLWPATAFATLLSSSETNVQLSNSSDVLIVITYQIPRCHSTAEKMVDSRLC